MRNSGTAYRLHIEKEEVPLANCYSNLLNSYQVCQTPPISTISTTREPPSVSYCGIFPYSNGNVMIIAKTYQVVIRVQALWHRQGKQHAQSGTAGRWQSQNLNPSCLSPAPWCRAPNDTASQGRRSPGVNWKSQGLVLLCLLGQGVAWGCALRCTGRHGRVRAGWLGGHVHKAGLHLWYWGVITGFKQSGTVRGESLPRMDRSSC